MYDHLHTDPSNADPHYNFDYEGVFGILAWQVREKEEEIYESDDVKDEYKVMHVLWMRWITLHRYAMPFLFLVYTVVKESAEIS